MDNWFNLLQIGMNSVKARQALIGTNRALNTTITFLDNLIETRFSDDEIEHIDFVYDLIPLWKRKLSILDEMLEESWSPRDALERRTFAEDFRTIIHEIDSEMTALSKVLQKSRP